MDILNGYGLNFNLVDLAKSLSAESAKNLLEGML